MGSIKRERGLLKLVHPGRFVEVHRKPIRAEEVMKRNPRHCITRPDVFKFPWIVVKPESVLLPGCVFLIVPYHTIYDLMLKAKEQSNNYSPFSQQNQYPNNHAHQQLKQDSPIISYAGMSSKLQSHNQHIKGQFVRKDEEGEGREIGYGKFHLFNKIFLPLSFLFPLSQRSPNCLSKTMSPDMENVYKYDSDDRSQDSHVELLPKVINYEDTLNKMEQELLDDSIFEFTPYEAVKYYQNYSRDIGTEMLKKDVNSDFVSNERVGMLKSCLRRPDSTRKSLNLKVSFNISIEKQEQQRENH